MAQVGRDDGILNDARVGASVSTFLAQRPVPMLIDGAFCAASDGRTMPLIYPATGEVIAIVARGGLADAARSVAAARHAFDSGSWPRLKGKERGALMERLATALEAAGEDFAVLEVLQAGKSITEARGDVARAVDGLRYYAAATRMNRGETIEVDQGTRAQTVREPIGVVAAIVPWNVPLVLTVAKLAPALAVGNTAVVKPSEPTPLTALMLGGLALELGWPPGVINVVTGIGSEIGGFLSTCAEVDVITFTGSTRTGAIVGANAVSTHKRIQLEMGGKSANIIFADADIEAAIAGAAAGIFYGQGQICSAGSRLLVQRTVYDPDCRGGCFARPEYQGWRSARFFDANGSADFYHSSRFGLPPRPFCDRGGRQAGRRRGSRASPRPRCRSLHGADRAGRCSTGLCSGAGGNLRPGPGCDSFR